jgi:Fe-S oxidoreductase
MLDAAKVLWRRTLKALEPEIEAGTPVIGLEPACVSAFRDELVGLFRGEERAQRLSRQTFFLTEFLDRHCELRRLSDSPAVLVQMHCHQHSVIKPHSEKSVLGKLGLDHEVMASGCCGMAGSFGFEKAKYPVSMACAERALLPKVRSAEQDTIILANGFSCREQIEQATGRGTMHIAELIARGIQ